MNNIFEIAGIGIVSSAVIIILKQYRPEFAFSASLICGIILLLYSVISFSEINETLKEIILFSGIENEKYEILFRCLGISIVSKIASEACSECGQGSISSKIDLAGKTIILLTAMPLFTEIIEIIRNLTEL